MFEVFRLLTAMVKITRKKGDPWISVPPITKAPEPVTLTALKQEISRRWDVIDPLNLVKDADHVTHFTSQFSSVAFRTNTDPGVLRRRLLICFTDFPVTRRQQPPLRRDEASVC